MKKAQLNAIFEGIREGGRVVLIAIIPVAIDSIQKGYIDWREIAVVGSLALLRAIEKALYIYKPTNTNFVTEFLKFE